MTPAHPLDAVIGETLPSLRTPAELAAFEATPYAERISRDAAPTRRCDSVPRATRRRRRCCSCRTPIPTRRRCTSRHRAVLRPRDAGREHASRARRRPGRRRQPAAAAACRRASSRCSAPQAAGIANPVNPLLEAGADRRHPARRADQGADRRSARCPAPTSGSKVERIRGQLPDLKAVVVVHGAGDAAERRARLRRARSMRSPPIAWSAAAGSQPDDTAGVLPHRRHDRHAEAGAPHPRATRSTRPGRWR